MGTIVKPPEGQVCESPDHQRNVGYYPEENPGKLARVFGDKGEKFCYEWYCKACRLDLNNIWESGGWPQGDDGKFRTPVHCPTIPGLD